MIDKRVATVALGIGALGVAAATLGRRSKDVTADRAHTSRSVTIRSDAQFLYELWCALGPLPELFGGERDVAIVTDQPAELLEWRNVHRKPYRGGGSLAFIPVPGGRGTEVRLSLHLDGPSAHTVSVFQRLHGGTPAQVARESLRRFKALAESGEIPKAVAS
jgi:uncharacterized membrane protein